MTTRSTCKIRQNIQEHLPALPLGCYAAQVDCWVYALWCEWALLEGWCSVNSEVGGVLVAAVAAAVAAAFAVACVVFAAAPAAAVGTVSLPAVSSAGPGRTFIIWLIELLLWQHQLDGECILTMSNACWLMKACCCSASCWGLTAVGLVGKADCATAPGITIAMGKKQGMWTWALWKLMITRPKEYCIQRCQHCLQENSSR